MATSELDILRAENSIITFCNIVYKRLSFCKGSRILLCYDGSLFDRLAFHLVSNYFEKSEYRLLCSVRPCMDKRLEKEIRLFSSERDIDVIGYKENCSIDYFKGDVLNPQCTNVSSAIKEYFEIDKGILLTSSITNNGAGKELNNLLSLQPQISWRNNFAWHNDDWTTVLLFKDIDNFSFLLAAYTLLDGLIENYHIPSCIISCHDEGVKANVKTLVDHCQNSFIELAENVKLKYLINDK